MEPINNDPMPREDAAELNAVILQCIKSLLEVLSARIVDDMRDDLQMDLGEIRIINDPDGVVGERIARLEANNRFLTFFACVPTETDAYMLEYQMARWAVDPEILKGSILSIQPEYAKMEFLEGLEDAVEQIKAVLFKATVIPTGSLTHTLLHRGAMKYS